VAGSGGGFEKSIARPAKSGMGRPGCMVGFFAVFLVAGLGMFAFFVWPIYKTIVARASWTEVPCEILSSSVGSHPGDDSTTYSVDVRYRYTVDGQDYESDRYRFLQGSSSGYQGKAEVVESLPPGTVTTCRVDPEDPAQAVLFTGFSWSLLLVLFPIPFIAVGAGGIAFTLSRRRRRREAEASGRLDWLPEPSVDDAPGEAGAAAVSPVAPLAPGAGRGGFASSTPAAALGWGDGALSGDEPIVLEPSVSPLGKLFGIIAIAAFWNGITGVFVWQIWKSWAAGAPDGCLTVFMIPFVLIGLALLAGIPYQFLALFNPRPRVELSPGRIILGAGNQLSWSFRGRAGRIRRLKIVLEGVEEADYRQGTNTRTDKETFATLELVDESSPVAIAQGTATITIPADTMHSFEAPDNRIVWKLKLQGEIARWPDVSEEMKVIVEPMPREETS
jgi:hypothetical protein